MCLEGSPCGGCAGAKAQRGAWSSSWAEVRPEVQADQEGSWEEAERAQAQDIGKPEGRVPKTAPGRRREGQGRGWWGGRCLGFEVGASETSTGARPPVRPPPHHCASSDPLQTFFSGAQNSGLLLTSSLSHPPWSLPQVPEQTRRHNSEEGVGRGGVRCPQKGRGSSSSTDLRAAAGCVHAWNRVLGACDPAPGSFPQQPPTPQGS